mmetsp:Transcript_64790/g.118332  ORF Transcript_64790/g.118332 Transcript_64790/m.118332 type:complete len:551 (+) Transcript_64790:138-1790(+)
MELPVALIVVIEFCERLCYYTFAGTQKTWLQNQGYSNARSSSLTSLFGLLSYVSCFLGGWLAETKIGRFRTIAVLAAVYTLGCYLAASATRAGSESVALYLVGTFMFVALGTGGIKPNVCTFGADQIDPSDRSAAAKRENFFSYFYVTINLGSCVAFGFLATVATNGIGSISREDGFFFAYLVAACAMAMALIIFLGGHGFYRRESFQTNSDSVLMLCANCLLDGWAHPLGKVALLGWFLLPVLILSAIVNAFITSWAMTSVTLAVTLICILCLCVAHYDNNWLGRNEVTRCLDCVPTLIVGNVAFAILYNTMLTVFYSQSCQMDTRIWRGSAMQISGAFFNLADCIGVILFTPVVSNFCLPYAERLLGRPVTLDMKVYAGMACAMSSQLVAMVLEYARLNRQTLPIPSLCAPLRPDGVHVAMSDMSAWWMCIPYFLIGMGEVLVLPVLQHFTYEGASPSMRSLMQAFNLFAMGGMPGAISSTLNLAMARFTPNNLNQGSLPAVYQINIVLALFGCALYRVVSSSSARSQDDSGFEKAKLADSESQAWYG